MLAAAIAFAFTGGSSVNFATALAEQTGQSVCVMVNQAYPPRLSDHPAATNSFPEIKVEADSIAALNMKIGQRIDCVIGSDTAAVFRPAALTSYMQVAGQPWKAWTDSYKGNLANSFQIDPESELVERIGEPLPFSLDQLGELDFDKNVIVTTEFIDRHGIVLVADGLTQLQFLKAVVATAGAELVVSEAAYELRLDTNIFVEQYTNTLIRKRASATNEFEYTRTSFKLAALQAFDKGAFAKMAHGDDDTMISPSVSSVLELAVESYVDALRGRYSTYRAAVAVANFNAPMKVMLHPEGFIMLLVPQAEGLGWVAF